MKLRTLLCGAALAAANLLLPTPQADAVPLGPHRSPVAVPVTDQTPHQTYCFYAYRPLAPVPLHLAVPPAHPC